MKVDQQKLSMHSGYCFGSRRHRKMTSSKPQSNKNSVFELGKHCSLVHTLMVSTCAVFLLTLVGWLNDPNYDVLADIAKRALGHHKDTVGLLRKPSELKYLEIRDNLNSDKTYLAVADYPSRLVASISGDTLRPLVSCEGMSLRACIAI